MAPPNLILAKRTTVADIKELAAGLTQAECHSLAVYFALCGVQPVQDSAAAAILEVKRQAATAFKSPVGSWVSGIQEHIPMSFFAPGGHAVSLPLWLHQYGTKHVRVRATHPRVPSSGVHRRHC